MILSDFMLFYSILCDFMRFVKLYSIYDILSDFRYFIIAYMILLDFVKKTLKCIDPGF